MSDVPFLDLFREREAQILRLYFVEKRPQADIARLLGVTQAAVTYRLDHAIRRLHWLYGANTGTYLGRMS